MKTYFYSILFQMSSMMFIKIGSILIETQYETLIQTFINSNLTLPNLWRLSNVCLFTFGLKKDELAFFNEL